MANSDDYQIFNRGDRIKWTHPKTKEVKMGIVRGHGWNASNPETHRPADTIIFQADGEIEYTPVNAEQVSTEFRK